MPGPGCCRTGLERSIRAPALLHAPVRGRAATARPALLSLGRALPVAGDQTPSESLPPLQAAKERQIYSEAEYQTLKGKQSEPVSQHEQQQGQPPFPASAASDVPEPEARLRLPSTSRTRPGAAPPPLPPLALSPHAARCSRRGGPR